MYIQLNISTNHFSTNKGIFYVVGPRPANQGKAMVPAAEEHASGGAFATLLGGRSILAFKGFIWGGRTWGPELAAESKPQHIEIKKCLGTIYR